VVLVVRIKDAVTHQSRDSDSYEMTADVGLTMSVYLLDRIVPERSE